MGVKRRISFWRHAVTKGGSRAFFAVAALSVVVSLTLLGVLVWWLDLAPSWAVSIALLALIVIYAEGSYHVWDQSDQELSEARQALDVRKKKEIIVENLARRMTLGSHSLTLGLFIYKTQDQYESKLQKARESAKRWSRDTYKYLQDSVGWDAAALFDSDDGLPSKYDGARNYLATEEDIENFMARRRLRLEQIMVRIRKGDL